MTAVAVLLFALVPAGEPEPPGELVTALSSPHYVDRERATEQLVARGPSVIPTVLDACTTGPLESRRRALRVLKRFSYSADAHTAELACRALHELVRSERPVAEEAEWLIARRRHRVRSSFTSACVSVRMGDDGCVRSLFLGGPHFETGGLATLEHAPNLELLCIEYACLETGDLAEFEHTPALRSLCLRSNWIEDGGLASLRNVPELRHLDLWGTLLDDEDVRHVAPLTSLRTLNLGRCPELTDAGVAELTGLVELRQLVLCETGVSNSCWKSLARFRKLEELSLEGTNVDDEIVPGLAAHSTLRRINLHGTGLTEQGRERLRTLRPDLELGRLACPSRNRRGCRLTAHETSKRHHE